jgi:hypothetical protein
VAWLIKVVNQKSEVVQQGVFETLVATRLREGKAVTKSLTERPVEAAVGDDNTNKESSSPPS